MAKVNCLLLVGVLIFLVFYLFRFVTSDLLVYLHIMQTNKGRITEFSEVLKWFIFKFIFDCALFSIHTIDNPNCVQCRSLVTILREIIKFLVPRTATHTTHALAGHLTHEHVTYDLIPREQQSLDAFFNNISQDWRNLLAKFSTICTTL